MTPAPSIVCVSECVNIIKIQPLTIHLINSSPESRSWPTMTWLQCWCVISNKVREGTTLISEYIIIRAALWPDTEVLSLIQLHSSLSLLVSWPGCSCISLATWPDWRRSQEWDEAGVVIFVSSTIYNTDQETKHAANDITSAAAAVNDKTRQVINMNVKYRQIQLNKIRNKLQGSFSSWSNSYTFYY